MKDGFIFPSLYVGHFLRNKHIVVIGDSIQRGVYKDLVALLQDDALLENTKEGLKGKGEPSFKNDRLTYRNELSNGRDFFEAREFVSADGSVLVQYYFVTRCYYERTESILKQFEDEPPDIVIMNSCLWDISRYGENSEQEYKQNMNTLFTRFHETLPQKTMVIWCLTLPLSSKITPSGFLLQEISFLAETLRVCVLEANYYVAQIALSYGFDVLDLHYYLRSQIAHREPDGVHWDPFAHRHITELILTFLHDSWGVPLPGDAIDKIKSTGMELDLKHFSYQGAPSFTVQHLQNLARLASLSEDNENSGSDDREDEIDDEAEACSSTTAETLSSGSEAENIKSDL